MTYRKDFDISKPEKPLLMQAANCGIEVLGEETERAYMDFEISEGPSVPQEGEFLDIKDGDTFSVEVKPENERHISGRLRLHLPNPEKAEWDVSVRTNNGRIVFTGVNGHLEANTNNGRTEAREIKGAVTITCANGSVTCHKLEGQADVSTSNGRIELRESSLESGSFKSGNGRIVLQFRPVGEGDVSVFSGNGRVKLALPEDGDYRVRVQTRGKLYNHMENYSVQTLEDATVVQMGSGDCSVLVQNFNGGVTLVKYDDVDRPFKERFRGMEFDEEFDVKMGDFFRNIFSNFDPGECGKNWSRDFADEVPHIMSKMANFGSRFGRMGEQISRQFHENRPGRGRDEEVKIVLNMLQEGKISAEEAERLINAIKAKKGEA
jgi:hypothetical protein